MISWKTDTVQRVKVLDKDQGEGGKKCLRRGDEEVFYQVDRGEKKIFFKQRQGGRTRH